MLLFFLSVPLLKTVSVNNETEGYITGLAFPWCEVPFLLHLLATMADPAALCGFLFDICSHVNGNRNMVGAPLDGSSCLVHSTQLGHQFYQEVLVCHVLNLLCVAYLTVYDVGICCSYVHKVQKHGTVPASSSAMGRVILEKLV